MNRLSDMGSRFTSRRVVVGLVVGAIAACGGSGGTTTATYPPSDSPPTAAGTVNATPQIAFSPSQLTVAQGGTVTFAFGSVGHNVFFDSAPSGAPADITGVNSNTNVVRVFGTAGVYNFTCHIHPGMRGTITVAASTTGYP